ncbi:LytR/AlgR family response regulator transcription factor [Clostridium sp. JNZ J1-5]
MKIAICDDNINMASYIEDYIDTLPLKHITCEVFTSGRDLIHFIESENQFFNIYFMDIEMSGKNGIETSKYIRQHDKNALIIFITNYKEYVYQVFDVLPFRFLVKPIDRKALNKVLGEAIEYIHTMKQIFFFKQEKAVIQVPFEEILFFEGNRRKVRIVTLQEEYQFYSKISEVKEKIDMTLFFQIHASYLVNMEHVKLIDASQVILKNNICLSISRRFRKDVKEQHLKYLEWRCGR